MLYVGTSGFSYKDWIGPFYPSGTTDRQMLEFYTLHFRFVEVNATYYHMPGLTLFNSLNNRTAEDFAMSVKLFQGFTHSRDMGKSEAEKFCFSLGPVIESGKLLCLLAQFPYSFHYTQENLDYLKKVREWFGELPLNVEIRNRNWVDPKVLETLKKENLGFVTVDEPRLGGLVGYVPEVTSTVGYIRLHGRNAAKWYGGEGAERYDYLYSRNELLEWAERIRDIDEKTEKTVVAFNNHPRAQAIVNANMLTAILQGKDPFYT